MLFTRTKTDQLRPAEAAEAARRGELILVDVRELDERAEARPAGSRHLPLSELASRLDELAREQTVAFICRSGSRSAMAARIAAEHGLTVVNVRGGLLAWSEVGLPVESGPEQPRARREAIR